MNCARGLPPAATVRPRASAGWWQSAGRRLRRKKNLGTEFETTFDQKTADFAMALGTFYCMNLQETIIDEIRRDGVVFARVYDLRGGPTPKLLTLPPP